MQRAQYAQRGPVPQASIECVAFEAPALTEGQVLIQVLAAPINPSDVLTLTGQYGMLPPLPAIGGNEGVGRVIAHGPGVSAPPIGQTVLLPVGSGTWATHVVGQARKLMPLPNDADPLQLAMMTVNPPTAQLLLSEFVDLQPGEWVMQNAANSGVGEYLVQLAALRGLKTVNLVRRESAVAPVKAAGGDVVLVDGADLRAARGRGHRQGEDPPRHRRRGRAGHQPPGRLPGRGRHAGQLRHDERRRLLRVAAFLRVPRRHAARLLAGAVVPPRVAGAGRWRCSARSASSSPAAS